MHQIICNLAQLGVCENEHCDHRELHEPFPFGECSRPCCRNQDARCFNPF